MKEINKTSNSLYLFKQAIEVYVYDISCVSVKQYVFKVTIPEPKITFACALKWYFKHVHTQG